MNFLLCFALFFYSLDVCIRQALIFRYKALIFAIRDIFCSSEIQIASFEKIISNPHQMFNEIGVHLSCFPDIRELNVNSKVKSQNGIYTNPGTIKIRDLIITKINDAKPPFGKQTCRIVRNIIRGHLNFKVHTPAKLITYPDFQKAIEDCRADLDWLRDNYGITF